MYLLLVRNHFRFSYGTNLLGHGNFVMEFLCSQTLRVIVSLDLDWCYLETFSQIELCFKYANNEMPGIRPPEVWSRLMKLICRGLSFFISVWFSSLPCQELQGLPLTRLWGKLVIRFQSSFFFWMIFIFLAWWENEQYNCRSQCFFVWELSCYNVFIQKSVIGFIGVFRKN